MADSATSEATPLLEVRGLDVRFRVGGLFAARVVHALRGVDLAIERGTALAVVGESGCGKSTLARAISRLLPVHAGNIEFDGSDVRSLRGPALRSMRSQMQMVFQDPYSSLDPSMRIVEIVGEPLRTHRRLRGAALQDEVADLLDKVGLSTASLHRYPYELSGGQRQRVAIARAIALHPKLVICDEAVSALDVSTQNQIVNLLQELRDSLGIAYLFITHDLAVAWHLADKVAVMYAGQVVEAGARDVVFDTPSHPYTAALLRSVPVPDPRIQRGRAHIPVGEVADPLQEIGGCAFHPRCPAATDLCRTDAPEVRTLPGTSVAIRCHHPTVVDNTLASTVSGSDTSPPAASAARTKE